jgi:hypothetical protein
LAAQGPHAVFRRGGGGTLLRRPPPWLGQCCDQAVGMLGSPGQRPLSVGQVLTYGLDVILRPGKDCLYRHTATPVDEKVT